MPALHVLGDWKWLQGSPGCDPLVLLRGPDVATQCPVCCRAPPAPQPLVSASPAIPDQSLELGSCLLSPASQPSLPGSFQTSSFVLSPMSPLTQRLDFF